MKPIIKWVGGKQGNLHYIKEMLPEKFNTYYEPFFGGGAVLFDLIDKPAVVSDINSELINLYNQVKTNAAEVAGYLNVLDCLHEASNNPVDSPKDYYYKIRKEFNESLGSNTVAQAARFIYLNKHCFNGLYRVNKKGEFNVPFNGKVSGSSYNLDNLKKVSSRLQTVDLKCCDFEAVVKDAKESDLVYFDPPYDYEHEDGFVDYASGGWTREDTMKLKLLCDQLVAKGCYIMLSNNSTTFIRELFNDDRYIVEEIPARRAINCKGTGRSYVPEVIIRSKNCI